MSSEVNPMVGIGGRTKGILAMGARLELLSKESKASRLTSYFQFTPLKPSLPVKQPMIVLAYYRYDRDLRLDRQVKSALLERKEGR